MNKGALKVLLVVLAVNLGFLWIGVLFYWVASWFTTGS